MLYNVTTMASTWHTVATRDVKLLRHQLGQVFALPKEYTFLNYLRCHDDIGWGLDYDFLGRYGIGEVPHKRFLNDWFCGRFPGSDSRGELYNDDPRLGDARLCGTTASLCGVQAALERNDPAALDLALRLDIMLHAYMFTLSGIPVLYAGDEIAQLNDDGYRGDPIKAGDSRYLHRGDMDWDKAERRADPAAPEGRVFRGHPENEGPAGVQPRVLRRRGHLDHRHRRRPRAGLRPLLPGPEAPRPVQLRRPGGHPPPRRKRGPPTSGPGKPPRGRAVALPLKDFAWLALDYNAPGGGRSKPALSTLSSR